VILLAAYNLVKTWHCPLIVETRVRLSARVNYDPTWPFAV
jgi:hypothetical protein